MAYVSAKKKDVLRGQMRRETRRRERVLDRLSKLGAQFWSAADCLRTTHALERMKLRGITYREFLDTWLLGDWLPDANDASTFIASLGRCRIVVAFRDETPHLVTAKYVAAHQAV
jgi:hypothetical protein